MLLVGMCAPDSRAVSVYLADENGNTSFSVDVDEEFYVALWVTTAVDLAGYEAKITYSSNVHISGASAHGDWFSLGRTVFNGTSADDHRSGILTSPTEINGSGDLVIFTFTADEEGTASFDMDTDYFMLANTDAQEMEVDAPDTLYVTINEGKGGGGKSRQDDIWGDSPDAVDDGTGDSGTDDGGAGLDRGSVYYVDGNNGDDEDDGGVDHPWATISYAISQVSSGDTIRVAGATGDGLAYEENLAITKSVTLSGGWHHDTAPTPDTWEHDPDNYVSKICAADSDARCIQYSSPGTKGEISHFTITGGKGGITCFSGTAPRIANNIIIENTRADYGGGIFCHASESDAPATIVCNTITKNSAYMGGGVDCYNCSEEAPTLDMNIITENSAESQGGGVHYHHMSCGSITNNAIAGNVAGTYGGGIHCHNSTPIVIANNTIVENKVTAHQEQLRGGGVCVRSAGEGNSSSATITNCILWGNLSEDAEGKDKYDEIAVVNGGESATASLDYCDVSGGNLYVTGNMWSDGTGNINDDPDFVGTDDYHLQSDSPCIDKGTCVSSVHYDGDGYMRPVEGNAPPGQEYDPEYDIGAYEYGASQYASWPIPGDANLSCKVNILDLIFVRNSLGEDDWCQEQNWQADVTEDGKINILDLIFVRNRLYTTCE